MAKLKLTYFDFDGGRGEPARLALYLGGVAFDDQRIPGKDWPAMDAAEEITGRIGQTLDLPADAKKKAREELAAGHVTRYLEQFQARLKAAGGEYFADHRLTVADLKVFMLVRWLRSGALDHIPKDLVDRVAPQLVQHLERVTGHPKIAEYYKRRKAA